MHAFNELDSTRNYNEAARLHCESAAWRAATGTVQTATRQVQLVTKRISNPGSVDERKETVVGTTYNTVHETFVTSRWVNANPPSSAHDHSAPCWIPAHLHACGETKYSLYP